MTKKIWIPIPCIENSLSRVSENTSPNVFFFIITRNTCLNIGQFLSVFSAVLLWHRFFFYLYTRTHGTLNNQYGFAAWRERIYTYIYKRIHTQTIHIRMPTIRRVFLMNGIFFYWMYWMYWIRMAKNTFV